MSRNPKPSRWIPPLPCSTSRDYIPLHSAPAGEKFGRFDGEDVYTTAESERLVRLPMYYGLTEDDQNKVIAKVLEFYEK